MALPRLAACRRVYVYVGNETLLSLPLLTTLSAIRRQDHAYELKAHVPHPPFDPGLLILP